MWDNSGGFPSPFIVAVYLKKLPTSTKWTSAPHYNDSLFHVWISEDRRRHRQDYSREEKLLLSSSCGGSSWCIEMELVKCTNSDASFCISDEFGWVLGPRRRSAESPSGPSTQVQCFRRKTTFSALSFSGNLFNLGKGAIVQKTKVNMLALWFYNSG